MGSPFDSWMDRFYLEFPNEVVRDSDPADRLLAARKGDEHEREYLDILRAEGRGIYVVKDRDADGKKVPDELRMAETLKAISEGHEVIYQAALFLGEFGGYSDFLVRVDKPSRLGDFQYEVWDTKLATHAKPYFLIQLLCYSEIIEQIQGVFPEVVQVVLGNKVRLSFRTADFRYIYRQIKSRFLEFQRDFTRDNRPEPNGSEGNGRWASVAEAWIEAVDHLSQVANIRRTQIKKLETAGIMTLAQLAGSDREHVEKLDPATLVLLKQQAAMQMRTRAQGHTAFEILPPSVESPRSGLALLPPASPLDVCFDMEGFPYFDGGLEYLFGVVFESGGRLEFKDWWAHSAPEEKIAFEGFVDWVYDRWHRDPGMHIYHYGHYEVTRLRKLMGRYGSREMQIDALLRGQVFVDLFKLVRNSVCIGEPSYSIKYVEHLYKEARSADVATASESVVQYQDWLDTRDGDSYETSKILRGIRDYNEEDCVSTWQLVEWLRTLQTQSGYGWIAPVIDTPDEETESNSSAGRQARARSAALAEQMLADASQEADPERRRILELFAWLLEFHWREARPVFWAMYERSEMTEEQLTDDIDCLAGLERTPKPAAKLARAKSTSVYEYRFDADQDTKLTGGKKCFFAHNLKAKCEIHDIDTEAGIVSLKISDKLEAPERLSIIPDDFISAAPIADSIYRTVYSWRQTGRLRAALFHFLRRSPPRFKADAPAADAESQRRILRDILGGDAVDAIKLMDGTTLCIQGPPGAGKTYQASRAIVALLQAGKTVGISSNSHKAVSHLMRKVAEKASELNVTFRGVKIKGDEDGTLDGFSNIGSVKAGKDVFDRAELDYQLIGGSAWAFALDCAAGKLDYLFVDEAGQVSVANLVGMAPCARNIVLMGDQMQLGQPIQGTHPGESGQSTLEYLLQGHATIPDDFGIFLGVTHRLHPDLCRFISDSVYEGRLTAHARTEQRVLILPETGDGAEAIVRASGMLYLPVEHEGNTQGSEEEAECVRQLVEQLQRCRRINDDGLAVPVQLDDILIVAPYNMQVRKIKSLLPNANVGSVDKFQGQERPIVIISMCTSYGDASPRGLEFLFNKNRLNVAMSRAQTLAVVVGSPQLALARCSSVEQMELVNLYCRIVQEGSFDASSGQLGAAPQAAGLTGFQLTSQMPFLHFDCGAS